MTSSRTRRRSALIASIPVLLLLAGCSSADTQAGRDLQAEEENRELVTSFYEQFFNDHETEEAAEVVADDYIQHNPGVPDGKEPFVSYFTEFFEDNPDARAEIVRTSTDGDLVWVHSNFTDNADDRGDAVVDIFRVDDGMIVEHWDVIQEVPAESANENTMF